MTDACTLLLRLLDLGEVAVANRALDGDSVAAVRAEVARAAAAPVAGERFVGAEALLLGQVLGLIGEARAAADSERHTAFCQVAGVLLPLVRALAGRALVARRNTVALPADPPDYHPRRGVSG